MSAQPVTVRPAAAAATPLRLLTAVLDAAASAVAGRRARVRVSLSAGGLVGGRTDRVAISIDDLTVAGLDLASLAVTAHRMRLVPGLPPRLRAGPVEVRATVLQDALDRWLLGGALPVRLALRSSGLRARAGLAGVRLAEVQAGVEIDQGRLVVTPQRAQVLGVGVGTPALRLPLPLPPLPRSTRIEELVVGEARATVSLRVDEVDEALSLSELARVRRLLGLAAPPTRRPARVETVPGMDDPALPPADV